MTNADGPVTWIEEQLAEISKSRALTYFGALLALTHVVTYYAWSGGDYPARFAFASRTNLSEVCWPLWPWCRQLKFMSDAVLPWVTRLYLALGVAGTVAFALRRVRPGYALLAAATALKLFFYAQDYRFGGEAHYLLFMASAIYLLLPGKMAGLHLLIVLSYFFAGLLHLNAGWVTGADVLPAMLNHGVMKWLWDHGLWTPAAAYVVLLTTTLSFGIFARRREFFVATVAQLALLHLVATPIVGLAGTVLALSLLALVPLARGLDEGAPRLALPALTLVSLFALLQILPMVTAGDHVLTGEGRLGAVTMFDAARTCRSAVIANFDGRAADMTRDNQAPPQWLECDPYFVYHQLRHMCRDLALDADFRRLTWHMNSRRGRAGEFKSVVKLDDVCRADVRYSWLGRNDWISR